MDYSSSEQQGRFLLRALLWFILLTEAARGLVPAALVGFPIPTVLFALLGLLPLAVVLWAIYRGSFPGMVVFFLSAFQLFISVTDFLGPGGPQLLGEIFSGPYRAFSMAGFLFSVVSLVLRLAAAYNVMFRGGTVGRYFDRRRYSRRRKDLVLEIALFVLALLASFLPALLL